MVWTRCSRWSCAAAPGSVNCNKPPPLCIGDPALAQLVWPIKSKDCSCKVAPAEDNTWAMKPLGPHFIPELIALVRLRGTGSEKTVPRPLLPPAEAVPIRYPAAAEELYCTSAPQGVAAIGAIKCPQGGESTAGGDLEYGAVRLDVGATAGCAVEVAVGRLHERLPIIVAKAMQEGQPTRRVDLDRKSTRLNSSHLG